MKRTVEQLCDNGTDKLSGLCPACGKHLLYLINERWFLCFVCDGPGDHRPSWYLSSHEQTRRPRGEDGQCGITA
jgi:hypothetical protein